MPPQLGEQPALVVAQANGCDSCLAAHTVGAKLRSLSDKESLKNRQGQVSDPRQAAALKFALFSVDESATALCRLCGMLGTVTQRSSKSRPPSPVTSS
ncbi:hypothetical protein ACFFLM_02240 [Deinococcus oregonensis]|uniref:Carboxymuconolactone decarboxylase-like domain-containing protein n=1 Tax=Deinococcus oregonensis TaxID=1805970 RepID=A0ABV6ATI4_9DEIO